MFKNTAFNCRDVALFQLEEENSGDIHSENEVLIVLFKIS